MLNVNVNWYWTAQWQKPQAVVDQHAPSTSCFLYKMPKGLSASWADHRDQEVRSGSQPAGLSAHSRATDVGLDGAIKHAANGASDGHRTRADERARSQDLQVNKAGHAAGGPSGPLVVATSGATPDVTPCVGRMIQLAQLAQLVALLVAWWRGRDEPGGEDETSLVERTGRAWWRGRDEPGGEDETSLVERTRRAWCRGRDEPGGEDETCLVERTRRAWWRGRDEPGGEDETSCSLPQAITCVHQLDVLLTSHSPSCRVGVDERWVLKLFGGEKLF
jgi:hypothetical protein